MIGDDESVGAGPREAPGRPREAPGRPGAAAGPGSLTGGPQWRRVPGWPVCATTVRLTPAATRGLFRIHLFACGAYA